MAGVSAWKWVSRLSNGVLPESALQRCTEFASRVEGCLRCVEKTYVPGGGGGYFRCARARFCAITEDSGRPKPVWKLGTRTSPIDINRGTKRARRWLDSEEPYIPNLSTPLDEKKIFIALRDLSLDKWGGGRETIPRVAIGNLGLTGGRQLSGDGKGIIDEDGKR